MAHAVRPQRPFLSYMYIYQSACVDTVRVENGHPMAALGRVGHVFRTIDFFTYQWQYDFQIYPTDHKSQTNPSMVMIIYRYSCVFLFGEFSPKSTVVFTIENYLSFCYIFLFKSVRSRLCC